MNHLLRVRPPRALVLCLGLLVAVLLPSRASALTITNLKAGPVAPHNNATGLPVNTGAPGDTGTNDTNCFPTNPSPTLTTGVHGNTDYCITFNFSPQDPASGEDVKDTLVQLPVGTQGDIDNAAKCSLAAFNESSPAANTCPPESQVGTIVALLAIGAPANTTAPAPGKVYALDTPSDKAALLGVALFSNTGLQSKYTITVTQLGDPKIGLQNQSGDLARGTLVALPNTVAPIALLGSSIRFWGNAASHPHLNATNTGLVTPAANFMRVGTTCQTDQTLTLTANPYTNTHPSAQSATSSTTYKLTDCDGLGFNPTFSASISGETQPGGHPQLDVKITSPSGDEDLGATKITLPAGIATDLSRIQNACPQATFQAGGCPESAVIGSVKATLDGIAPDVLGGDVVMVKVDGKQLPALGLNFKGRLPLRVFGISEVDGSGRLVSTFSDLPSLPQRTLDITLLGGSKGILQTDPTGKCTDSAYDATLTGQNGKTKTFSLATTCAEQFSAKLSNSTKTRPVLWLGSAAPTGKKVKSLRVGLPKGLKWYGPTLRKAAKVTFAGFDKGVDGETSRAVKLGSKAKFTFPGTGSRSFSVLTHTGALRASSSFAKSTKTVYVQFRVVYSDGSKVTKYVAIQRG